MWRRSWNRTSGTPASLSMASNTRPTLRASSGVPSGVVNTRFLSSHAAPAASRSLSWFVLCAFKAATTTCGILIVRRLLTDLGVSERRSRLLGLDEPTATRTEISGSLSVDAKRRLDKERELFSSLSIEQMRELAGESQRLVDRLMAMASANARTPDVLAPTGASVDEGETTDASHSTCTGDDVDRVDDRDGPLNRHRGNALKTPMPVGVSQPLPEGIDEAARGAPGNQSTAPTVGDQQGVAPGETAPREDGP